MMRSSVAGAVAPVFDRRGASRRVALLQAGVWLGIFLAASRLTSAENTFPMIDGELTGEITPLKIPGAPTLRWKLVLHPGSPAARRATATLEGPGTALEAELQLDPAGNATWKIASARIDMAIWFAGVGPPFSEQLKDIKVEGTLDVTGQGTWKDGEFGGQGRFKLEGGRIDDPAHKLVLEGIALDLSFEDLAHRRAAPGQILTWSGGRYDEIDLGPGRFAFSVMGEEVSVTEASALMLGGEVKLAAFSFALSRPEMSVIARVVGIDVSKLLPLLPPVLREARGRLDGSLTLRRDSTGIQIGAGRLALEPGKTAEVRFEPTPGLLSRNLPSTVLKYYPGLGKIETGEIPMQANLLEIAFTPDGDAEGRSAYVHLAGGPVDPRLRAPIDLTINVRGPLESLLKLGTSGRLRFGTSPPR